MLPEPFRLQIPSHRQILNAIRIHKEISAADLARLSNLQPSTLVYILRALKEKKLIEVSRINGELRSAGKPPTLWRLVPETGYIIGLEIIPNEMRATVIDFSCNIIHQDHKAGFDNVGPEKLIAAVDSYFHQLTDDLQLAKKNIIGVGVGLTGLVDRERGIVHFSRKLELQNYGIEAKLRGLLGLPVEVVNDANAGALGIKWQVGETAPVEPNVIFLTLNEKIGFFGAGLILNHVLYEGADGTAGEIFASLPTLSALYEQAVLNKGDAFPLVRLLTQKGKIEIDDVIACARQGCEMSRSIMGQYQDFMVEEIIRLVQLLNPNVFVIGGDITDAKDLLFDAFVQQVGTRLQQIFPTGVAAPKILFSRSGIYSVSLGATALILRKIFA
ncbi:ROK family transcriptional regulator [candidate division KSB1 bacterium]|nr:ROK family transcriptional regulator [candidate division KSB1 bacterium]RQW08036.1 MAG: ROK family transcriptional regulator [candidate division KSB1 bacterium]